MEDHNFETTVNSKEINTLIVFKNVVLMFLKNEKDPNYKNLVQNMLARLEELVSFHALSSPFFSENLGSVSKEH